MKQIDFNISSEDARMISVIKDPFQTNCITNVAIHYSSGSGYVQPYWYGYVKFKNGNTFGEQNTSHVSSFEEIVVEMRQILNSITNEKK